MRYIGNKTKLLTFLHESIANTCGDISELTFCDLFAGTCSVGRYFKNHCKHVISNDLEQYSFVLAKNYVCNNEPFEYAEVVSRLNSLPPKAGKITKNFSPHSEAGRMFFTTDNAMKIDAIREEIESFRGDEDKYYFLLASLLESADVYANTTGVYGAYLKKFNSRSSADFSLSPYVFPVGATGECHKRDANELVSELSGDILYLDPPYNNRQYGANYHILNYIADYDFKISVDKEGNERKTGVGDYNKSTYSRSAEAYKSLCDLIENSGNFKYVFLSYNNEGIITTEQVKELFSKHGEYKLLAKGHKRYKSNRVEGQKPEVEEYLHVLERK